MRVLCLHGRGTSGAIFKSQTASFRHHLSDLPIEYDFIDGPIRTAPAPGVDLFYDPPYYAFWEVDNLGTVNASGQWLREHIARSGPYDAVIMFSQACAAGSGALLLHAASLSNDPPLAKAAIFICGGPSLDVAESVGYTITPEMRERDQRHRTALNAQSDSSAILARGSERWTGAGNTTGLSEDQLREEFQGPVKIDIPTVHIYGDKDPRYTAGVQLSAVCDPNKRRTFNHEGGHEIPRKDIVSRKMASLVRWALEEAGVL